MAIQRQSTDENHIKEIKIRFGMDRMPSGEFGANESTLPLGS
jgi:hypothetical protein